MPTMYDFLIFNDTLINFRDVVMMSTGAAIEAIISIILLYGFKREV